MTDDTIPLFAFPAVQGKKITAAFDGGRMSSDGGVMLLSLAERRLGVAERRATDEAQESQMLMNAAALYGEVAALRNAAERQNDQ